MNLLSRREWLAAHAGWIMRPCRRFPVRGTYLQLAGTLANWDSVRWREAFAWFDQQNLNEYVVQWTVSGGREHFETVATIIRLARERRARVWVGLVDDAAYWQHLELPGDERRVYLQDLAARGRDVAQRLAKVAKPHGWYIPQEIEPVQWRTAQQRAMLSNFLRDVSPKGRVGISAFSNGTAPVGEYASFWKEVLKGTPVKTLFFQDGVGTGKLTVEQAEEHLRALRRARVGVRAVVELFEQTSRGNQPFAARPAPLDRVDRQVRAAGKEAVGFSVPEYLSPFGNTSAQTSWQELANACR